MSRTLPVHCCSTLPIGTGRTRCSMRWRSTKSFCRQPSSLLRLLVVSLLPERRRLGFARELRWSLVRVTKLPVQWVWASCDRARSAQRSEHQELSLLLPIDQRWIISVAFTLSVTLFPVGGT